MFFETEQGASEDAICTEGGFAVVCSSGLSFGNEVGLFSFPVYAAAAAIELRSPALLLQAQSFDVDWWLSCC